MFCYGYKISKNVFRWKLHIKFCKSPNLCTFIENLYTYKICHNKCPRIKFITPKSPYSSYSITNIGSSAIYKKYRGYFVARNLSEYILTFLHCLPIYILQGCQKPGYLGNNCLISVRRKKVYMFKIHLSILFLYVCIPVYLFHIIDFTCICFSLFLSIYLHPLTISRWLISKSLPLYPFLFNANPIPLFLSFDQDPFIHIHLSLSLYSFIF